MHTTFLNNHLAIMLLEYFVLISKTNVMKLRYFWRCEPTKTNDVISTTSHVFFVCLFVFLFCFCFCFCFCFVFGFFCFNFRRWRTKLMRRENGTKLKNLTFDLNLLLAPTRAHQVCICICFLVVSLIK